jgi:hypothetical protein
VLRVASARTIEICLQTVLRCTRIPTRISFTRLELVHELLAPRGLVRGMTSPMGRIEYSVGTVVCNVDALDPVPQFREYVEIVLNCLVESPQVVLSSGITLLP